MSYGVYTGGNIRDLERCGLFAEMSYLIGEGYVPQAQFNAVRNLKRSQMYPGVPKVKTGLQDCYFDKEFKRVFSKEGWTTIEKIQRQELMKSKEKNMSKLPFTPTSCTKNVSCPGEFDGTFAGHIPAMSPLTRPKTDKEKLSLCFKTQPGKKGGPGYIDITINPYPKYMSDPYKKRISLDKYKGQDKKWPFYGRGGSGFFDINPYLTKNIISTYKRVFDKGVSTKFRPFLPPSRSRQRGDRFHGGISTYPEYISSPIKQAVRKADTGPSKTLPFYPQPRNKEFYTNSIMQRKVDIGVNHATWRDAKPITFTNEYL